MRISSRHTRRTYSEPLQTFGASRSMSDSRSGEVMVPGELGWDADLPVVGAGSPARPEVLTSKAVFHVKRGCSSLHQPGGKSRGDAGGMNASARHGAPSTSAPSSVVDGPRRHPPTAGSESSRYSQHHLLGPSSSCSLCVLWQRDPATFHVKHSPCAPATMAIPATLAIGRIPKTRSPCVWRLPNSWSYPRATDAANGGLAGE